MSMRATISPLQLNKNILIEKWKVNKLQINALGKVREKKRKLKKKIFTIVWL